MTLADVIEVLECSFVVRGAAPGTHMTVSAADGRRFCTFEAVSGLARARGLGDEQAGAVLMAASRLMSSTTGAHARGPGGGEHEQ